MKSPQSLAAPLQRYVKGFDPSRALGGPQANGRRSFMNPAVPAPSFGAAPMPVTKIGGMLVNPIAVFLFKLSRGQV